MSAKICPDCKFANRHMNKNCTQCGFSFPPVIGFPDRSQDPIKWVRPEQWVTCPHCNSDNFILGDPRLLRDPRQFPLSTFPQFKCDECNRDFFFYGPFEVECQGCLTDILLRWESWNAIAVCPNCDQRYRLKIQRPTTLKEDVAKKACNCCASLYKGY